MSADPETIAVYDRQADDYQRKLASRTDPHLERFIAALPDGATVLDLGCGPGHAAQQMQAAGLLADAYDAAPEMVALARTRGVAARQATFSDPLPHAPYDGVWASFSLLHAPRADMAGHLAAIHDAMRPGGLFAIGLKTGEGEKRDTLGRRYTYYSEPELVGLLERAGFRVATCTHGEGMGLEGMLEPWIVVTAHA